MSSHSKRTPWLVVGLLAIVLGLGAAGTGVAWTNRGTEDRTGIGSLVSLVTVTFWAYPWQTGDSGVYDTHTITITFRDGSHGGVETHVGPEQEAEAWLATRNAQLDAEYGYDKMREWGPTIGFTGFTLLVGGIGTLVWRRRANRAEALV